MSNTATTPASGSKPRLKLSQTLLIGALAFGLFFGAGNLIFPVEMGRAAGDHTTAATIGFLLTATGLPVLGLIASAISGSSSLFEMTSSVGRRYAFFFTCALYLTIGPAFAIPRTATVSYEIGIADSVPNSMSTWALLVFTLVFFGVTGAAALRPGNLMDYVGRYLTPLFLVLLGVLIVAAIVHPMGGDIQPAKEPYNASALPQGFLDGYNTMDALASLAFAIVIIEAIRRLGVTSPHRIAAETAKAGVVSIVGMSVIYASLAFIGATSLLVAPKAVNGGITLAQVSQHYFGGAGKVLIAAIVIVACLKTAIGLVTACAEMFTDMFSRWLPAMTYKKWAVTFTLVSLVISNFGLADIIKWSIPVLMFLYPLAITAIILGLLTPLIGGRRPVYVAMTTFVALAAFFDFVKALPVTPPGADALVTFAHDYLPWYDNGFGWVVPAIIGFALGFAISFAVDRKDLPQV